jgi:hypothetical protein
VRRAAHIDVSQHEVCETLDALGATIQYLHGQGRGCPDLMVGVHGRTYAVEIKNPKRPNRWEADQLDWWKRWNGNLRVVLTCREDAWAWMQTMILAD